VCLSVHLCYCLWALTWREVVEKDSQAHKLNKEDAVDRSRWRKMIKHVWWSGWLWVGECFFWYQPTRIVSDKEPLNGWVHVCVGGHVYCTCVPCGLNRFRVAFCIELMLVDVITGWYTKCSVYIAGFRHKLAIPNATDRGNLNSFLILLWISLFTNNDSTTYSTTHTRIIKRRPLHS